MTHFLFLSAEPRGIEMLQEIDIAVAESKFNRAAEDPATMFAAIYEIRSAWSGPKLLRSHFGAETK